jgi:hypothetical protein
MVDFSTSRMDRSSDPPLAARGRRNRTLDRKGGPASYCAWRSSRSPFVKGMVHVAARPSPSGSPRRGRSRPAGRFHGEAAGAVGCPNEPTIRAIGLIPNREVEGRAHGGETLLAGPCDRPEPEAVLTADQWRFQADCRCSASP